MNNYSNQHKEEEANLKSLEHAILIVKGGVTTIGKKVSFSTEFLQKLSFHVLT